MSLVSACGMHKTGVTLCRPHATVACYAICADESRSWPRVTQGREVAAAGAAHAEALAGAERAREAAEAAARDAARQAAGARAAAEEQLAEQRNEALTLRLTLDALREEAGAARARAAASESSIRDAGAAAAADLAAAAAERERALARASFLQARAAREVAERWPMPEAGPDLAAAHPHTSLVFGFPKGMRGA